MDSGNWKGIAVLFSPGPTAEKYSTHRKSAGTPGLNGLFTVTPTNLVEISKTSTNTSWKILELETAFSGTNSFCSFVCEEVT